MVVHDAFYRTLPGDHRVDEFWVGEVALIENEAVSGDAPCDLETVSAIFHL
jgi:hypothetical protein